MTEQEYIDHINDSISEINSIDFTNNWAYEEVIHAILKIKKLPIILFKLPKGSLIFRSRINSDDQLYKKVLDLSAPENKFVTEYARANKPRQVLFYGSETRPVSYLEFANKLSETTPFGQTVSITVGAWEILKELLLVLVFNPLLERNNSYNRFHGEAFDEFITKTPEELRKGTIRFFEFIGNKYGELVQNGNDHTYLITCAYSNIVFSYEQSDGIMYPSVPLGGEGFNVALKKNIVDANLLKLRNAKTDKFLATQQDNGKHKFSNISSVDSSSTDDIHINWDNEWINHAEVAQTNP